MLDEHFDYLSDSRRLERFKAAIASIVRPGDVVVDLGCGSGVLGLLCLEAGAARIVAIDSGPILEVARETFRRAGLADRCDFLRGRSFRVTPRELADVAICDHVGYFGFDYGLVALMQDARRRFLKPAGRLLPGRIDLMLGLIESQPAYDRLARWRGAPIHPAFHWLSEDAANAKHPVKLAGEDLLGAPARLGSIALDADAPEFFSWRARFTATRDGYCHGLAGWFDCQLAPGVSMTNSPLAADAIQRPQAFLPLATPVAIQAGEIWEATLMARPDDDLVAWTLTPPQDEGRRSGSTYSGSTYSGSTWASLAWGDELRRADPRRIPQPNATARARALVLAYCDGRRTAGEIEALVLRDHADLFATRAETARFVAGVLRGDAQA